MIGVLNYQAPPSSSRLLTTNNNTSTNNSNNIPPSNASVASRESDHECNMLIHEESKLMFIMLISFRFVYSY